MDYLKVFILSAAPFFEIRGGLPLGIYLGLSRWEAFTVSVLGNIVIVIPLLMLLPRLESIILRNRAINKLYSRMVKKVQGKRTSFQKYGKYALFLFVALPFPTTGAWTACVAAYLFRISLRETFLIVSSGVVISGIIILVGKIFTVSVFSLLL